CSQLNRILNGRKQKFKCGKCQQESMFYECEVDDSFKAFLVVEVWKRTKRVMQCGECLAICDYYSLYPEEKKAAEEKLAREDLERKEREQKVAAEKQAEEEKERARQAALDQKSRAAEAARKDKELDDELEKLKRKMGL
ncbi:MAG: hypothetical protein K2X93_09165, partial [Candidatus Obscuribacterales bacterium]|nr:hypothetical protein [Candidatus Obscuribacterales bacterium]